MSYAYAEKIANGYSFKSYILLRLGRIYPLHLFMLLVYLAYTILKVIAYQYGHGPEQSFEKNNVGSFVTNLLLIHALGFHDHLSWNLPSWSISVEFAAYVVFFILMRSVDSPHSILIPLIISFLAFSTLIFIDKDNLNVVIEFGVIRCLATFYLGVFIFRIKDKLDRYRIEINTAEIIVTLLLAVAIYYANLGWLNQFEVVFAFVACVYIFSRDETGVIGRLLQSKPLRAIGLWSYSIYMTHYFIQSVSYVFAKRLFKVEPGEISGFISVIDNIVILVVTIIISRFTYVHIEDRFRRKVKALVNS